VKRFKGDHNDIFAEQVASVFSEKGLAFKSLAPLHFELRQVLDAERIVAVRQAQEWTRLAFEETLKDIRTLPDERQLGLNLDYRLQSLGDGDLAFPTIVAGGANACCLHYAKKDEPLHAGELVLLDFGLRCGTQHSDISRTVPISGRFNPLQKLLYQIVLDAQNFHQAQVKPGTLLQELDIRVWEFIRDALESRFVSLGGHYHLPYDVRPHGVSHLIGEQVHEGDPFRCYAETPLIPGMMISNEPDLWSF
jgi:Xaa-Pro aminopeptidase